MKFTKIIAAATAVMFLLFGGVLNVALGEYEWEADSPEAELRAQMIASLQQSGAGNSCTPEEERIIWDFLLEKIGNPYGVAGLMGNLYSESALRSINLQQRYERLLDHSDESYTLAVDLGIYPPEKFINDRAGYGLAQWTHPSRKQRLMDYAKKIGAESISDLQMQLEFLWIELQLRFPHVLRVLQRATSVKEASDCVLTKFEQPKNQGPDVQRERARYGQRYYNRYALADGETEDAE